MTAWVRGGFLPTGWPQGSNVYVLCAEPKDHAHFLRVARLQSEFCTKDFFLSYEFSYEKCSEIFPEFFEPLFCGSEKIPGKFPPNFPLNFPNFPAKNQKKKSPTSFCRSAGTTFSSGHPAGRIGDWSDREIVCVPNVYVPCPGPQHRPVSNAAPRGLVFSGSGSFWWFALPSLVAFSLQGTFDHDKEQKSAISARRLHWTF